MKLLVEELRDGSSLSQSFSFNLEKRAEIKGFYPYLFMSNAPTGTFTFSVTGTNGFSFSKSFTSQDIKNCIPTVNSNIHVFFPILPSAPIFLSKGDYTMTLSSTGYFYNRGSFVGWIKQFENLNVPLSYTPSNDAENPLAFRLKVFKEGIL